MSLVIVEGPDGAGKSTLINRLVKAAKARDPFTRVRVTHHGAYLDQPKIATHYLLPMFSQLTTQRRELSSLTIFDRSWLAEPIYGAVMRGGVNRIQPYERRMLERLALGIGAVVVVCLPSVDDCLSAWYARRAREYPDSERKLRDLHSAYGGLIAQSQEGLLFTTTLVYDYTREPFDNFLSRLGTALHLTKNVGYGIGNPHAHTLLVGDTVSQRGHRYLPFISLDRGGCSAWLADYLETHQIGERRLYWVNQAELDEDFVVDAKAYKVVALGNNASRWLDDHTVAHSHIAHPQFWKRFKRHETYPLVNYV